MARLTEPTVVEQRAFGGLRWLTLHAPELAGGVRAGQYLLVRCADPASADPLLRRALFVAAADRSAGTVALLYAPDERGTAWLAGRHPGERLDCFGPLGAPFTIDNRTRALLLAGAGPGLAALLLLAREAVARGSAVVLLAAAPALDLLPPPFLLPADVEYQGSVGEPADALAMLAADKPSAGAPPLAAPLVWADQLGVALPLGLLPDLAAQVRAAKLRWQRGFAQALLDGPLPCGAGACLACLVETRDGLRTRCKDGPVFDLRDLAR